MTESESKCTITCYILGNDNEFTKVKEAATHAEARSWVDEQGDDSGAFYVLDMTEPAINLT